MHVRGLVASEINPPLTLIIGTLRLEYECEIGYDYDFSDIMLILFNLIITFYTTLITEVFFLIWSATDEVTDHNTVCLFRGEPFDRGLVHSIESVIIEWTHQIQSVLKRNSAQPLLEGHNPGPLVELDFWKARAANLECIFEQVRS